MDFLLLQKWSWNILLCASLFAVPFLSVFAFVNSTAISYGTTTAISFLAVVTVCLILLFGSAPSLRHMYSTASHCITVGFPLTVIGGIAGRRLGSHEFAAPCRTKLASRFVRSPSLQRSHVLIRTYLRRQIPPIPWYRQAPVQMVMAGFLPFSAIYIGTP